MTAIMNNSDAYLDFFDTVDKLHDAFMLHINLISIKQANGSRVFQRLSAYAQTHDKKAYYYHRNKGC